MKWLAGWWMMAMAVSGAAERSAEEQGLVDWDGNRGYVMVDGLGSATGSSLVWKVAGAEDVRRTLFDVQGTFSAGMGQKALRRMDDVAVGKAAAGDGALAEAIARAAFEERLDWLGYAGDNRGENVRYSGTVDYLERFEPYSLPLRLKSADLMLEASFLFKGYGIDMHLARQRILASLKPDEIAKAERIRKLEKRQKFLSELRWRARDKRQMFDREFGREQQSLIEELAKFSVWERMLMPQTAYGLVPTLAEMRGLLGGDALAVDIVVARSLENVPYSLPANVKKVYVATAFDSAGSYGPYVLGEVGPIDRLVKSLGGGMQAQGEVKPELVADARRLRQVLLEPVLKHAAGKRRLLISLDGELQFAPVPMLPDGAGRFLVQDYEVSFFDSFRQLANTSSWRSLDEAESSVLLGDPVYLSSVLEAKLGAAAKQRMLSPLAGTRREIEGAGTLLKGRGEKVKILLGNDATEAGFYAAMREPADILHFATHGCFFDPTRSTSDPLQLAALALGKSEDTLRLKGLSAKALPDDGLLQASEILKLDLRDSRMVILSACNTAMGKSIPGDLVLGFRGAFFIAGAPNIVLTLVPVSDAVCPILMTNLYRVLPEARDECEAWTEVVRYLLKDPALADVGMALKLMGPFVLVSNRQAGAADWPVGPVRGFINWRRPLAMHRYVRALSDDARVGLYLTAGFRKRLAAVDSPQFGLVPAGARVMDVEVDGDEAYVKVNAYDRNSVFVVVKEGGRWLVDDIIETTPGG